MKKLGRYIPKHTKVVEKKFDIVVYVNEDNLSAIGYLGKRRTNPNFNYYWTDKDQMNKRIEEITENWIVNKQSDIDRKEKRKLENKLNADQVKVGDIFYQSF